MRSALLFTVAVAHLLRLAGFFTDPLASSEVIHRVTGDSGPQAPAPALPAQLTIVSWNIERGTRFDGVLARLRSLDADIILLQEVDRYCRRTGNRDVAADLAKSLGMFWVAAGEFQEIGEGRGAAPALTGQAILSRTPIAAPATIVFASQAVLRWRFNPVQPRRGGRMALKASTAGVLLYNAHLESGGKDTLRHRQLDQILVDASRERDAITIIAGDLNTTARAGTHVVGVLAGAGFRDALRDQPGSPTSRRHKHPLDWIFVRGAATATGAVQPSARTSDHFPLVAHLRRR